MSKVYRMGGTPVYALRQVSLAVEAGEFVAVLGRSGAGKSTLMNLLGCLDLPDTGEYLLAGEDVARMGEGQLARIRNRQIPSLKPAYSANKDKGAPRRAFVFCKNRPQQILS